MKKKEKKEKKKTLHTARKYVRKTVELPIKMILVEMTNDLCDAHGLKMTT